MGRANQGQFYGEIKSHQNIYQDAQSHKYIWGKQNKGKIYGENIIAEKCIGETKHGQIYRGFKLLTDIVSVNNSHIYVIEEMNLLKHF